MPDEIRTGHLPTTGQKFAPVWSLNKIADVAMSFRVKCSAVRLAAIVLSWSRTAAHGLQHLKLFWVILKNSVVFIENTLRYNAVYEGADKSLAL
jgi:hypothetical protein